LDPLAWDGKGILQIKGLNISLEVIEKIKVKILKIEHVIKTYDDQYKSLPDNCIKS